MFLSLGVILPYVRMAIVRVAPNDDVTRVDTHNLIFILKADVAEGLQWDLGVHVGSSGIKVLKGRRPDCRAAIEFIRWNRVTMEKGVIVLSAAMIFFAHLRSVL